MVREILVRERGQRRYRPIAEVIADRIVCPLLGVNVTATDWGDDEIARRIYEMHRRILKGALEHVGALLRGAIDRAYEEDDPYEDDLLAKLACLYEVRETMDTRLPPCP